MTTGAFSEYTNRLRIPLAAMVPVAGVIVGVTLALSPSATILCLGTLLLLVASMKWPHWLVGGLLVATFAAKPSTIPVSFEFGPIGVFWFEPLLLAVAAYSVFKFTPPRMAMFRIAALAALLAVGFVLGISNNSLSKMASDGRGMFVLFFAFVIGNHIAGADFVKEKSAKLILLILWWTAALTLLSSVGGLAIEGRSEVASLYLVGGSSTDVSATRILSPGTFFSVAVLYGIMALLLSQNLTMRKALPFLVPASLVVLLSFSRNHLLGLVAALLYVFVFAPSIVRLLANASKVGVVSLLICVVSIGAVTLAGGGAWVQSQADAYSSRVIGGLTESRNLDVSVRYREEEADHLTAAIIERPVAGHGFGFEYQPAWGLAGSFTATIGRYYAHNFYLWTLAKTGLLGLTLFVFALVLPLRMKIRGTVGYRLALGTAAAGLLVISFVAPIPLAPTSAVLLGLAIGLISGGLEGSPKFQPKTS